MKLRIGILFFLSFASLSFAWAQKVYVLELKTEIDAPAARYMMKGIEAAKQEGAAALLLHLDTYGGRIDHADSIRNSLLDAGMPTAVFINRNAGSAGALISIACDSIFMAPGATIGAATVVNSGDGQAAPDKYQSYWKGIMRTTAEMKGRNPAIAEKMVDQNLDLPGISPQGQVITFSTQEALQNGYCDAEVESLEEVLEKMGLSQMEVVQYKGSSVDQAINFLINPTVTSILILLIFVGVFMEMKTPGVGFAGALAVVAIAAFFAPHYIEGLVEAWEIALFTVGIILIAVEIFVVPGFGVPGVLGIAATVTGLVASVLDNHGVSLEGTDWTEILEQTAWVLVMMVSGILVVVVLAKRVFKGKAGSPLVDTSAQTVEEGYTVVSKEILEMLGETGVALTDLKPSGYVEVKGEKVDATALGGMVDKGTSIVVEKIDGVTLIVRAV